MGLPATSRDVGGFASEHSGKIVPFAMGDGSVRRFQAEIGERELALLANRHDGKLPPPLPGNP
jgi:prepilin-type processing-associated H-X9-DG protein